MKLWAVLLLVGAFALAATADSDDAAIVDDSPPLAADSASDNATAEDEEPYASPALPASRSIFLQEHFDDSAAANLRWTRSASKKAVDSSSDDAAAQLAVAQYDGEWAIEAPLRPIFRADLGLVLKSKAKHAAIAAPLERPFRFADGRPLVVQYEVQLQDGQSCGGSYVKLLTAPKDNVGSATQLKLFNDQTPYTIMFGPDKCGNDVKLHFIFRHVNPLTGAVEEKHCRKAKERLEEVFKDKQPHLYTLVVRPDNTYEIRMDRRVVNEGSLLADFTPAVNPEKEIDDAGDSRPADWDEREKIADPLAEKPLDWDETAPAQIVDAAAQKPEGWLDGVEELMADPQAVKPADWDTEMDGEWEAPLVENEVCKKAVGCGLWQAPMVPNPAYKGKWLAPLVENPNYRGKWAPRKIANPDWFEDLEPAKGLQAINAVGFELWSMSGDILFDNILVTDDEELADQWAAQSYDRKAEKISQDSKTLWVRLMRHINYSPGYYFLYFCYCCVPVSMYVTYLYRRSKDKDSNDCVDGVATKSKNKRKALKESFVERILKYGNANPQMYAVFLIFVGLPVTFLMYFFCKSAPVKPYESTLKRNKKSDLNQDDDAEAEAEAEAEDDTEAADAAAADESTKAADESATSPANTTGDSAKSSGSGYSLRNRTRKPSTDSTPKTTTTTPAAAEDDAQPSDSADSASASNNEDDDESSAGDAGEEVPQLVDVSAKSASPPKPAKAVETEARKRLRPRKE